MNTVKLPTQMQSASMSRVTGAEMSALDMLGNQLVLDPSLLQQNPELAKLMQNAPEGVTFDQLLAQVKNGEVATESLDPKLLAQISKNNLDQKSLQIGETKPELLNNQTQQLNTNIPFAQEQAASQAPAQQKSIIMQPQVAQDNLVSGKNANAEDASRAFMPERRSIFAVNKQQAPKVAETVKPANNLMDFNTFMNKQAPSTKANMAQSAYANQAQESMFSKKVEGQVPNLAGTTEQSSMKVTDLMLMSPEQNNPEAGMEFAGQQQSNMKASTMGQVQTTKVFDMGQLNGNQDVINQIQDYIIQAKASSEPTVQMSFAHKDLGMVDLMVQKSHGDQVSIMINTHSMEGAKFFNQNQGELLQTLTQSGVNVADLKLDSSSNTNSNNQENLDGNNSRNSNQQHARDEKQQRNEDSQRRQELWNLLNNREAA